MSKAAKNSSFFWLGEIGGAESRLSIVSPRFHCPTRVGGGFECGKVKESY